MLGYCVVMLPFILLWSLFSSTLAVSLSYFFYFCALADSFLYLSFFVLFPFCLQLQALSIYPVIFPFTSLCNYHCFALFSTYKFYPFPQCYLSFLIFYSSIPFLPPLQVLFIYPVIFFPLPLSVTITILLHFPHTSFLSSVLPLLLPLSVILSSLFFPFSFRVSSSLIPSSPSCFLCWRDAV